MEEMREGKTDQNILHKKSFNLKRNIFRLLLLVLWQGLAMWFRIALNFVSSCLCLPNAGMTGGGLNENGFLSLY